MTDAVPKPLEIFYVYAYQDKDLCKKLEIHLSTMKRQGFITEWHDQMIPAGAEWSKERDAHLNTAQIILLLISPDFLASDYCISMAMGHAMERHKNGTAQIIPIILRPADWQSTILGTLRALPSDGKPVVRWRPYDNAFLNITEELRKVIEQAGFTSSKNTSLPDKSDTAFLTSALQRNNERILHRFVAGSNKITIKSLFEQNLLMPFRWQLINERATHKDDIVEYLYRSLIKPEQPSFSLDPQRYLILADPGVGKSTLTYVLYNTLSSLWLQGNIQYFPVYIDLRDYIGRKVFEIKRVIAESIDSFAEDPQLFGQLFPPSFAYPFSLQILLILDSLDEFLSGMTPYEIIQTLAPRGNIFVHASIITCRKQYYERYLAMDQFSASFSKIYLRPWEQEDREHYIQKYFQFCSSTENPNFVMSNAAITQRKIDRSAQLRDLCQVPLRLNMILELLSSSPVDLAEIEDLLGLYLIYVDHWLKREVSKPVNLLTVEQKYELLKKIAWHFYEEGRIDENISLPFTRTELRNFLQTLVEKQLPDNIDGVIEDLLSRTLLVEEEMSFSRSEPTTIRFIHKSLQEFFVAKYLYDIMMYDAYSIENAFIHMISPQVWEFLKEYIKRANKNMRHLNQIVVNCILAFENSQRNEMRGPGARVVRQQLAHYMGNMRSLKSFHFLKDQLEYENDLWTKRGIIVGLAIGGHEEYLHPYVNRLRAARKNAGDLSENEVNIGFHLSFFGDQIFDELNIDKDQGLPVCKNTIKTLIYLLGTETDRGGWRLDLYTLLEIEKYRIVSQRDCTETLTEQIHEFERIVHMLEHDPNCQNWPEVVEARTLVNKIKEHQ